MDPLSITASVVTIAGLAGTVVTGLQKLIDLRSAPNKVFEIINEISDLQATLHNLSGIRDVDSESISLLVKQQLAWHIKSASEILSDLEKIIHHRLLVSGPTSSHDKQKVNLPHWVRDRHRIVELREKLRAVKQSIQLDLATVSTHQLSSLQIKIRDITLYAERADHQNSVLLQEVQNIEQKIARCLHFTTEIPPDIGLPSTRPALQPPKESRQLHTFIPPVCISADHCVKLSCRPWCKCVCHRKRHIQTPSLFQHVLGSLLISYKGGLLYKSECNAKSCKQRSISTLRLTYFCPGWLISKVFAIAVSGPRGSLATLRVRSKHDAVFYHAQCGNIQSLRFLLAEDRWSPLDIDYDGWSLMHWAVSNNHMDTFKGLLDLGADPDLQDRYSSSAKDLAVQRVFIFHADYEQQAWAPVFDLASWIEEQEFSRLHHVLLDIHPGDLRQELGYSSDVINLPDAKGKTPLLWAAMRGDSYAVQLLLEFGADPNIADVYDDVPILYCYKLSVECLRELLEHGSMIKSINRIRGVSALGNAAGYSTDLRVLEVLLSAGADPRSRNPAQWTPCHYAVREDNLKTLKFLIEYGADLGVRNDEAKNLLCFAVVFNSHACLIYILEAGAGARRMGIVDRIMLHMAAQHANERTLRILASFELPRADPEARLFNPTADQWFYAYRSWYGIDPPSEALKTAFHDLLFKVREDVKYPRGRGGHIIGIAEDQADLGDRKDDEGIDQDEVGVRVPGSWI